MDTDLNLDLIRKTLKKIVTIAETGSEDGFIQYAGTYANAAIENDMADNELKVQVLYVMSNLDECEVTENRDLFLLLKACFKIEWPEYDLGE